MTVRRARWNETTLQPGWATGVRKVHDKYPEDPTIPAMFDVSKLLDRAAVASIQKAFTQARTGHRDWASCKRYGRLDSRQAARAAQGSKDIFRNRSAASITRVRLAVLIDASGSMGTEDATIRVGAKRRVAKVQRKQAAGLFGAMVAKALGGIPNVSLDIVEHSGSTGQVHIKTRWTKGTPVGVFNRTGEGHPFSGNADGHALMAVGDDLLKNLRPGEQPVLLVVSDGLPTDIGDGAVNRGGADEALRSAVAILRKRGVIVLGVAIYGGEYQRRYYGDGFIIFEDGGWTALGKALANKVGEALADKKRTVRR